MTTDPVYYVGGLRARLLNDSIFAMLNDCLSRLNWFNPNRGYTPINFVTGQQDIRSAIPFNTLAFSSENESEVDWELGSNLSEHHQNYLIDFFAESEALSVHLTRDIADILKGRYPDRWCRSMTTSRTRRRPFSTSTSNKSGSTGRITGPSRTSSIGGRSVSWPLTTTTSVRSLAHQQWLAPWARAPSVAVP